MNIDEIDQEIVNILTSRNLWLFTILTVDFSPTGYSESPNHEGAVQTNIRTYRKRWLFARGVVCLAEDFGWKKHIAGEVIRDRFVDFGEEKVEEYNWHIINKPENFTSEETKYILTILLRNESDAHKHVQLELLKLPKEFVDHLFELLNKITSQKVPNFTKVFPR